MSQDPTPTEEILELGRKIASLQRELSRTRLRSARMALREMKSIPTTNLANLANLANTAIREMIREMIESPHYNHDAVSAALDDLEAIIDRIAK